jgi:protein-tyrosine phosphatase
VPARAVAARRYGPVTMSGPLGSLEVVGDGPGSLLVRWDPVDAGAVSVAVGPSADPGSHVALRQVEARSGGTRITGLAPGRHYVSVSSPAGLQVAAERRVPLRGAWNFRDLGGYPVASGGATRWGAVFRSDSLHACTPEDVVHLGHLEVAAVFDLRRDDERAESPGPREVVEMTISGGRLADADPTTLLTRDDGERWLYEDYCQMLAVAGGDFGRLFRALADEHAYPAVVHCMGGKDRTGMAVALLLGWLGVGRELVLDDYELTGVYSPKDRLDAVIELFGERGIAVPAAEGLLSSPRWAMASALERLDTDHGGVERYLRERAGLDDEVLGALRANLVR